MNPRQLCGVAPRPMYAYCLPCAWVGPKLYIIKKIIKKKKTVFYSFDSIRASATGGPNAKCKVHLAFRPKMSSTAGRLKVRSVNFFGICYSTILHVRWHCSTMPKIILIIYSRKFFSLISHLSLSLSFSVSTLSSLSPSSLSHFRSVSDARSKSQTS